MSTQPTISAVIATYNSAATLAECLESIRGQRYPQKKIEIILADGGSTDGTFAIAKQYGAKVISVRADKQGAEYNRATGAHAAKNELLLFVDHDNVLPHAGWLSNMVAPLLKDPKVVGVETLHYTYDRHDSFMGRYFALFGVNDIFALYIGKADRMPYYLDSPAGYGVFRKARIKDLGAYISVDFAGDGIPTLGSNGFLIRRSVLFAEAKTDPDEFFHIDVNVDLIRSGHNRYAFIRDTLRHKTDERGLWDYLRRRKLFMEKYHFGSGSKRRYSLYERGDLVPTLKFVFYSLTFVVPLSDSIRGFLRIPDPAWFLNPVMSFCIVILYGFAIIQRQIRSYGHRILEA